MGRAHASQGWKGTPDPMEAMVEQWLVARGISFTRDHPSRLDFYLPALDLYIEVKRFATPRIADQLARVAREDVLVIQGIGALDKLRRLFGDGGEICRQRPVPHLTKLARAFYGEWHPDKLRSWGTEISAAVLLEHADAEPDAALDEDSGVDEGRVMTANNAPVIKAPARG